ncbi:MAG: ATP-binding protein, partial [Ktedonobacterales bacterium]|nr:ATP-binding protein [Ktedonobacterales bacterium]
MNKRTYREKLTRRYLVGSLMALAVVIALLSIFDVSLRQTVLGDVAHLASQRLAQVVAAVAAVVILAVLQIIDHLDQLRSLTEIVSRLFGYDSRALALRGRAFVGIPDEYVRRPALERELADALAPTSRPQLVVLHGERDSGKTTLIRFLVLRALNRRYHARVVLCRRDRQSIQVGPSETEERIRQRLAGRVLARVIGETGTAGDVGEAIATMSDAVAEHFRREGDPWLIIIDQIDDGAFPFEQVLPPLFGT